MRQIPDFVKVVHGGHTLRIGDKVKIIGRIDCAYIQRASEYSKGFLDKKCPIGTVVSIRKWYVSIKIPRFLNYLDGKGEDPRPVKVRITNPGLTMIEIINQ